MKYTLLIVFVGLAFVLLRIFFLVVLIIGKSMFPTLNEYDKVLALRHWPARWLKKGQIVVVTIPSENELFVKRVTALPGESFRSLTRTGSEAQGMEEEKTWEIPPEHFFVCGDNPNESYDSRYLGPLKYSSLYALVIFRMSRSSSYEIHV